MLTIKPVSAFSDNYIWLLYDQEKNQAFVVDPGDAAPVIAALDTLELELTGVLITHHHFDHVGGLQALVERYQPVVYGPHNPAIDHINERLGSGDTVSVLGNTFEVLEVPGHTLDHIAYFHHGDVPLLFCGDTLFAGGCGRVFEGTHPMMLASLQKLGALPENTLVHCAHEYTLGNLAFAKAVEPDNEALLARSVAAQATRKRGEPTVPSMLAVESATNPFLRCAAPALLASLDRQGKLGGQSEVEVFALVRNWKDSF